MGSPATLGAPPAVDVTLTLFGGTDTEIAPSDCPEGVSPDNQDMIFIPGDTSTRPCLRKLFAPSFGGVSVVYEKSYVQPNTLPLTLVLTSDGKLWVEDVTNTPGTKTQIGTVPPGLYAQSVSAFGREYIAISDFLHGQGVPLQFDGTNLDRVTQDGPGAPPNVADDSLSYTITAAPNGLFEGGANNVLTATEVGHLVTLTYTIADPVERLGAELTGVQKQVLQVLVAGVGAGYNGQFQVASLSFNAGVGTLTYISPTAGLAPLGAGGTVRFSVTLVFVTVPQNYTQADVGVTFVTIAGAGVGGYNGSWLILGLGFLPGNQRVYVNMPTFGLADSGGGTLVTTGNISIGTHQVVVMFLTRNGALTAPSPPLSWNAAGGLRAIITNLPIGPANVVARVLGFTGAGGDNFFTLISSSTTPNLTGPPTIIKALVVPDNTSTQAIMDFSDNALFAGIAIDQIGNDLFDQVVLGPVLGFFAFASRLCCWGDFSKTENFLNMGFDGGTLHEGWAVDTAGGTLIAGGAWAAGFAWQITGDGTANPIGRLTQSGYQDAFGTAILLPNTSYILRIWAKVSAAALAGNVVVDIFSTTGGGVLASATIAASALSTAGAFVQANFSAVLPATIPADVVLRVSEVGLPNLATVLLDEVEIVFAQTPYRNLARFSYVLNPEGFAQTTGNLGPTDDDSPIRNFSRQRNVALLATGEARHEVQDNEFEPDQWATNAQTHSVGAVSLKACDPGKFGTGDAAEDWDLIAAKNGLYLNAGADYWKVSQEFSKGSGPSTAITWDDINWRYQHTIWVKNDPGKRRAYIGVPVGEAATAPNLVFVLDYREMDTAAQIAAAMPIHISLQGKMKSSDLTRKWTRWNVKANCGEVLVRPGNERQFFLGGGSGKTPGTGTAYGNIYSLDSTLLTDDDYGRMFPYYTTYAFVDSDQEEALQLGAARKHYSKITGDIDGVGLVSLTPFVNTLSNPLPRTTPRQLRTDADVATAQPYDLSWTVGIHGERVFFRINIDPLPGQTDVQMKLQRLAVWMKKDPIAVFRSMGI